MPKLTLLYVVGDGIPHLACVSCIWQQLFYSSSPQLSHAERACAYDQDQNNIIIADYDKKNSLKAVQSILLNHKTITF